MVVYGGLNFSEFLRAPCKNAPTARHLDKAGRQVHGLKTGVATHK
jgi:hypothetical protein